MKSGFIYIWHDRRDRRFYIGSHWGAENDGYVCSSVGKRGMKSEHKARPHDFRRRIISRVYTSHADLLAEEQRWIDLIPRKEFGGRYYNLSSSVRGMLLLNDEAQKEARRKAGLANRGRKYGPRTEEWCRNISEGRKGKGVGRAYSKETREKMSKSQTGKKHSLVTREKISDNAKKQFSTEAARRRHSERLTGRRLSEEHCANISSGLTGNPALGWASGKIWITNGVKDIQISQSDAMPSGFSRGRRTTPPTAGKNWITDGKVDRLLGRGEPLPCGFTIGRSETTNLKIAAAARGRLPWNKGRNNRDLQKEMAE